MQSAAQGVQEDILRAAGATETIAIKRYAHLVGGCRMAADERHGVVDADHQSFAVPNLYLVDGSVLPTQGSANPALTIMALAARCADRCWPEPGAGSAARSVEVPMTITELTASAYTIPTDRPEADGTLSWDETTMVVVEVSDGDHDGHRLDLRRDRCRSGHRRPPRAGGRREATQLTCRARPGHGPGGPEPGTARPRRLRHLGRRHRPVGPQSPRPRRLP